tara:strand:+ start:104 stop:364 length:261 start_codon:yes stop_codon:yes gene_type:complete
MSHGQNVLFGVSGNLAAKFVFHSKILPAVLDKSGMRSFFNIFATPFSSSKFRSKIPKISPNFAPNRQTFPKKIKFFPPARSSHPKE